MTRGLRIAGFAALLTGVVVGSIRLFVVASSDSSGLPSSIFLELAAWSLLFWVGVGLLIAALVIGRGSKRGAGIYELAAQNPLTHFQVSPTQRSGDAWGLKWGGTYVLVVREEQLELLAPGEEGVPFAQVALLQVAQIARVTTVEVPTAGQMRLAVSIDVADRGTIELYVAKGRQWWFAPAASVQNLAIRLSKVVDDD